MSHCLNKMLETTTEKSYDFWYYQSLLEVPYTNLLDHGWRYARANYHKITETMVEEALELAGIYKA